MIHNTLNSKLFHYINEGLRRARLISQGNQPKLNVENLHKLEQLVILDPKQALLEATSKNHECLSIVKEDLLKEALIEQCVVCDQLMNDNELKLSQRLQWYTKERGELKKFIFRLKQRLQLKLEKGDKVTVDVAALDHSNPNQELPLVCFKCQYDIILGNEGRHKAIQFFNIAQTELVSNPKVARSNTRDPYLNPIKNIKMHQVSEEMREVGILSGTFYDYRNSMPALTQAQNTLTQANASLERVVKKPNQSVMISIAREGADAIIPYSTQYPNDNDTSKILRPWREDFADKITKKFGSIPTQERQQKILKKIEKDRTKYMTGQRLQMLNQKLVLEHKEKKQNERSDAVSKVTNKSLMMSSNNQYFTQEVHGKQQKIDRTFFRKISNLGAFANASFNGGVFLNPSSTVI